MCRAPENEKSHEESYDSSWDFGALEGTRIPGPLIKSLIAPPNTLVVSTFIVREFEQGSVSVGMAMAVLCVLFSTTALLILNTVIDHRKVH